MKHTYHIHGMTCNGCRSHVEETLSKVEGVSTVLVNLEKAEVTIEMKSHITLETFQKALKNDSDRYSIHNIGEHKHQGKRRHQLLPKEQVRFIVQCIAKVKKPMLKRATVLFVGWI